MMITTKRFLLLLLVFLARATAAWDVIKPPRKNKSLNRRAFLGAAAIVSPMIYGQQDDALATDCNADLSNNPCFKGSVVTEWLVHPNKPDRNMKLLQDFSFVDEKGTVWTAPAGYEPNGANIPRPLWSFIGSPFYGDFRRASVVHDYFCEDERKFDYDSDEVHDIFLQGMREDGVPLWKARLMDAGVRLFNSW